MLALCSMLSCTYYAHFNAGIIGAALVESVKDHPADNPSKTSSYRSLVPRPFPTLTRKLTLLD